MYCVKCGVELGECGGKCPLCGTSVIVPPDEKPTEHPLYPPRVGEAERVNPRGVMFLLTVLCAIPALIALICDLQLNRSVTWSSYVLGAIALFYVTVLLPCWFYRPNPTVFVPCDFAAAAAFLALIAWKNGGWNWYFFFALPVTVALAFLVTAPVTLFRYLRRGALYIWGGTSIAAGGFVLLLEFLLERLYPTDTAVFWAAYPFVACFLVGMMLIVIAICPPLRESLHKKFFL